MKRILIVEDERIVAEDMRKTLEGLNYEVFSIVPSGEKALEILEKEKEDRFPDLILMDILLQGEMTGIEAASQIKERFHIPVIYVTAFMDREILKKAKVTEPFGYIIKPFQEKEIHSTLEIALYKSRAERKMEHLNTLLLTIRKIHQILAKEEHPERLIRKISHIFSETRGYTSVWIALMDGEGNFGVLEKDGCNKFSPLIELVKEGEMTECMKTALSQEEPLSKGQSTPQCSDCRTRAVCPLLKGMMVGLRSGGKTYGVMAVTLPGHIAVDQEEIDLFSELAEDISFCLNSLDGERERAKAVEALQRSEERYRILVETAPDAVLVEQGERLVYINLAGLEMLGYDSIEDLGGKGLSDIWKEKKCRRESGCDFNEPCIWDGKFQKKDGGLIYVELSSTRSTYEGKGALQVMARDVTEVKSLREKTRRMEHLAYLGELSATLAHEIRNPLSSIGLNFRNLMESKLFFETNRRTLENIQRAISRIESIINNVLDYSRPSLPHFKKSDLAKILKSSLRFVQEEFSRKNIQILQELDESCGEVWMDPSQIFQVFSNLLINASQAMAEGGTLKIRIFSEGEFLDLQIEDNGKGIPPENMDRIFKPFFTTKTEGTGLGLAVVSRILEQHRCQILVESEMDRGTTFTLKFPLKEFSY